MLIAVIQVKNYHAAKKQLAFVSHLVDGIELRLDYAELFDINEIAQLRQEITLPVIFTLRKKSHGGFYQHEESQRFQHLLTLCQLNPDYIDIEYDAPSDLFKKIKQCSPSIKIIRSYHHFSDTPNDLGTILRNMQHPDVYAYKIVTMANNTSDALRMLQFVQATNKKIKLIGLCMGEAGQCTRILSRMVGGAMIYACIDETYKTAPGQMTLHELLNIYRIDKLNKYTKIYALLGDPVDLSVGHLLHNQALTLLKENAVYIKLRVMKHELSQVISQCRTLPIAGLSITMPLKESILSYLDEIDTQAFPIKANNTVVKQNEKYIGFNTDGKGAIQVLSERVDVAKQKIVILGAGGAARAIAYEALQSRAQVIILNRTIDRAQHLANSLGCESGRLEQLPNLNYTVLINTLPQIAYSGSEQRAWFDLPNLKSQAIAMDIIYHPFDTVFLQAAKKANCTLIYGYEMYIHQAIMQLVLWFNITKEQCYVIQKSMYHYFQHRKLSC